jgi:hypothetical protein
MGGHAETLGILPNGQAGQKADILLLSACGNGGRGGRTRTGVYTLSNLSAPDRGGVILSELHHNWRATHPRVPRREKPVANWNLSCLFF